MMALQSPALARFFFNFISDDAEVIRDELGVDLSIEGDVVGTIARALEDLYRESSLAADEWQGWRMVVADDTGRTSPEPHPWRVDPRGWQPPPRPEGF